MTTKREVGTDLLLELVTQLKMKEYASVQSLSCPHTHPTLLGLAKELATISPWDVSRANQHRLFDPSQFAQREHAQFQRTHPQAFMLYTVFFLNRSVDRHQLNDCLGERLVNELADVGILNASNGEMSAALRVVPYREKILLTDPWDRRIEGFAYIGKDSIDMAEFLRQRLNGRRFNRGLDICTGGGIHALLLADRCQRVVGVDINPRALWYSQRNALINGERNVDFLCSDLASALRGHFDIVVSNPPLRFLAVDQKKRNRDGFGGALGIELTKAISRALEHLLADEGMAYIGSVAPVVKGTNVLLEDLTTAFSGKPFQVELVLTDLTYSREETALHQQHRISSLLPCYIVVRKAGPSRITVTDQIRYKHVKRAAIRLQTAIRGRREHAA